MPLRAAVIGVWCVSGTALAIAPAATPVSAQSVAWTGSLYGATGTYIFTERSTNVALSTGLSVHAGSLRLSGSVPLVFQSTPWVAMGGAGPLPTGGSQHGAVGQRSGMGGFSRRGQRVALPAGGESHQIGLGDPLLFASLDVVREHASLPTLTITAGVKAPIASADDGFGTGEWDWSAGAAASRTLGPTMVFVDAAYWRMGDMPSLPLRDVVAGGGAIGRLFGDGAWSGMLSFSASQATIAGTDAPVQVGIVVGRRSAPARSLSAGIAFGLTSTAPDVAVSLGWNVPLRSM